MISGEKIATYIKQPSTIEGADLKDLQELQEKHPYCSSIYILHLKCLALTQDLNFEHQLAKTSIHVSDRAHLYQLIHSEPEVLSKTIQAQEEINDKNEVIESDIEEKLIEEAASAETKIEEIIIENPAIENTVIEEVKEPIEANEETFDDDLLEELEQGIYNHAIDIAFVDSGIDKTAKRPESEAEEVKIEFQSEPDEKLEEALVEEEANKSTETETGPISFVTWLKSKQNAEQATETIEYVEETTIEARPKIKIDALLEKFILEQPSISRPVKDFYNPVKNAKESIEESEDLVSETLAKIYALQKNYSKAITAYEKLILLYPEKKTFFASQIEKIREEIKKR